MTSLDVSIQKTDALDDCALVASKARAPIRFKSKRPTCASVADNQDIIYGLGLYGSGFLGRLETFQFPLLAAFCQMNFVSQERVSLGVIPVLLPQFNQIPVNVVDFGWPVVMHILIHRRVVEGIATLLT